MSRLFTASIFLCSCLLAWWIESRHEFLYILGIFLFAFFAYYYVLFKSQEKLSNPWFWAIIVRLPFLFVLPYLSDDVYRFIWDGSLQLKGINPFLYTPDQAFIQFPAIDSYDIFSKLNSQQYFSVYPAFNQFLFAFSAKLGGSSLTGQVVALRTAILLGEVIVLYLLYKIGQDLKKPKLFALYAFNPLVILEFTGNLHFEVWVIAFVLIAFYAFQQKNNVLVSAIFFGLAISTKLLPALFLPLIWKHLGLKNGFLFCLIAVLTFGLSFFPYYDPQIVLNMYDSIDLFFRTFEFNASIYYVMRWVGYQVVGYNWIGIMGLTLKVLTLLLVLVISFRGKSLTKSALLIYLCYLLLATTIHPWYILPIFVLSLFTEVRSILMWTGLVFLSYHAYQQQNFDELLWVVALEYLILFYFIWQERLRIFKPMMSS